MKSLCNCNDRCSNPALGLFVLRVITGLIFVYHGVTKLQHANEVSAYLSVFHIPHLIATALSVIEAVGGLALILGVWTCLFASLIGLDILILVLFVSRGAGWASNEFSLLLLASLAAIKSTGGGKWKLTHSCGCIGSRGKNGTEVCNICGHDSNSTCACECHPK